VKYARFLERETGEPYVRGETVVSGSGLNLLHRFLSGEDLRPAEIAARLDPGSETLTWMARFYARAARDYALQVLARGGLYIAGGVAAKLPALVTHPAFAAEFRLSATMARVLAQIPVFLITDEESGLWGAAQLGAQRLGGITN
jgi:glucokinase